MNNINNIPSFFSYCWNNTCSFGKTLSSKAETLIQTIFSSRVQSQSVSDTIASRVKQNKRKSSSISSQVPSTMKSGNKPLLNTDQKYPLSYFSKGIYKNNSIEDQEDISSFMQYIPDEIKIELFEFLDAASLHASSKTSKKIYTLIHSSACCQRKILYDFAVKAALSIAGQDASEMLSKIVQAQLKDGNVAMAQETVLLIEDGYWKSMALIKIAQIQKNGIEETKKILISSRDCALLIGSKKSKSEALSEVAQAQAQCGDVVEAEITFSHIEYVPEKFNAIIEIALAQAKNGNTEEVEEKLGLAEELARIITDDDFGYYPKAKEIIRVHLQSGDTEEAKEIALQLREIDCKFGVLKEIALFQAQSGNIVEAKETASHIDMGYHTFDLYRGICKALIKNNNREELKETLREFRLLIEGTIFESAGLEHIALFQLRCGTIKEAEETVCLITEALGKSEVLKEIAIAQAKSGDVEDAKKTFVLAREEVLRMELNREHDIMLQVEMLQEIAIAQAQNGDIQESKKTFTLAKKSVLMIKGRFQNTLLEYFAKSQILGGDIKGAKGTLYLIKEELKKSMVLKEIAIAQAKNCDTKSAKETIQSINNLIKGFSEVAGKIKEVLRMKKVLIETALGVASVVQDKKEAL